MIQKFSQISQAGKNTIFCFLIALVATLIYSNSFFASFHYDDEPAIIQNYAIRRFDLKSIFLSSQRPFLDFTFALNYYFGKLHVFGYHLVNLSLHITNGMLIYFILLQTVNPALRKEGSHGVTDPLSGGEFSYRIPFYASLIFVSHPIQTQAVTYIVNRSSVLATTFYLLALFLFIKAFEPRSKGVVGKEESRTKGGESLKPGAEDHEEKPSNAELYAVRPGCSTENARLRAWLYLAGSFLVASLGMGTKQEAATLPLMLLIYDYYFISRGNLRVLKKHYKVHLAIFSTLAITWYLNFAGLKMFVTFDHTGGVPMLQENPITSFHYFLTQIHVVSYYIKLLFIPTNLNLDYDWPITRAIDLTTVLWFVYLASIVFLAVKLFWKYRLISFCIIWFFVTLSVTSSFVVIYDVISEHRLYLPSVGFATFLALMINRITGKWSGPYMT